MYQEKKRLIDSDRALILRLSPERDGEQVSVSHCKPGKDNARLYLKRTREGVLFNCFHCGLRGMLRSGAEMRHTDVSTIRRRLDEGISAHPENAHHTLSLPRDCTPLVRDWDARAAVWVMAFGITADEVRERFINYSKSLRAVVFPMFVGGALVGYQSRAFPESVPKYRTKLASGRASGAYDVLKGRCQDKPTSLVICEDYLSTVKCTRVTDAYCCYGTTLNISPRVLSSYASVYLWFDHDNSQVIRKELTAFSYIRQFVPKSKIIKLGDPKRSSFETIKDALDL